MITEDYVSFETAKLLKEKGFCLSTKTAYNQQGIFNLCEGFTNGVKSLCNADFDRYYNSNFISAPTLQMAMKWLREMYSLMVVVHPSYPIDGIKYESLIYRLTELKDASVDEYNYNNKEYNNYEEACEAAIRYCLENLI